MTLPVASCKIGRSRRSGPWSMPQGFPVARAGGCAENVAGPITSGKGTSVRWGASRKGGGVRATRRLQPTTVATVGRIPADDPRGAAIRPHAGDRADG